MHGIVVANKSALPKLVIFSEFQSIISFLVH
jgi:hypothetical protein